MCNIRLIFPQHHFEFFYAKSVFARVAYQVNTNHFSGIGIIPPPLVGIVAIHWFVFLGIHWLVLVGISVGITMKVIFYLGYLSK